jgi:hypothetical protein
MTAPIKDPTDDGPPPLVHTNPPSLVPLDIDMTRAWETVNMDQLHQHIANFGAPARHRFLGARFLGAVADTDTAASTTEEIPGRTIRTQALTHPPSTPPSLPANQETAGAQRDPSPQDPNQNP